MTAIAPMPHSVEAEQSVLGALLLDNTAMAKLPPGMAPDHFSEPVYAAIFRTIRELVSRGDPADEVTVAEMGGFETQDLVALKFCVPSSANVARYGRIVLERAAERRLQQVGGAVMELSVRPNLDAATKLRQAAELVAGVVAQVPLQSARPALPLEWARDLGDKPEVPVQLIEGLLTVGGLSSMNGQPNAGKSYIAGHAALCVAAGRPWLGRRTMRGPVLYLAAEGAASVRARWQADRQHFGHQLGDIALAARTLNMLDPSPDVDALIATAQAMEAEVGQPVRLIVVDTVARVMAGGDENTAVDMGRLIGAADRVRQALPEVHVMLIHHMGKDLSKGARGHSSLRAALDTEIEVTVDEPTKTHYAKVTKQRDLASKGETFACKFVPVVLGVDQWGNDITACAVEPSEVGVGTPAPKRLTASQLAVMSYLSGQDQGVRRSKVVEALEVQGVSKTRAYAAMKELQLAGMLVEVQGLVYLPKERHP